MAAFFSVAEPSIVKRIYDFSREVEETRTRVLFYNHALLDPEEFDITLPIKSATVGHLQKHMSETGAFKANGWRPDEHFFFAKGRAGRLYTRDDLDGSGAQGRRMLLMPLKPHTRRLNPVYPSRGRGAGG